MKNILLFASLFLVLVACKEDLTPEEQFAADRQLIEDYLNDNNINATFSEERGIYHDIEREGTGGSPNLSSRVEVKYRGYFLDGEEFDATADGETIEFPLTGVIVGWQNAIPLLQRGGKGTFYIPSALAYGPAGRGSIPPSTPLIFDVELINF